jgi:hypothetical protein
MGMKQKNLQEKRQMKLLVVIGPLMVTILLMGKTYLMAKLILMKLQYLIKAEVQLFV